MNFVQISDRIAIREDFGQVVVADRPFTEIGIGRRYAVPMAARAFLRKIAAALEMPPTPVLRSRKA